jgi:hypothetical protein
MSFIRATRKDRFAGAVSADAIHFSSLKGTDA